VGKIGDHEICPLCGADLDDGEIPEEDHQYHAPPYRWSRVIGISDPILDRILEWQCPDCGGKFQHRQKRREQKRIAAIECVLRTLIAHFAGRELDRWQATELLNKLDPPPSMLYGSKKKEETQEGQHGGIYGDD